MITLRSGGSGEGVLRSSSLVTGAGAEGCLRLSSGCREATVLGAVPVGSFQGAVGRGEEVGREG